MTPEYANGTVERAACVVVVGTCVDVGTVLNEVDVGAAEVVAALLEVEVSDELAPELDVVGAIVEVAALTVPTEVPENVRQGSNDVAAVHAIIEELTAADPLATPELLGSTCRYLRRC